MGEKRGCFKTGMLGCLGLFLVMILFVGGTALMAWHRSDDQKIEEKVLSPVIADMSGQLPTRTDSGTDSGSPDSILSHGGVVRLALRQGGFEVLPARRDEGMHVDARYDEEVYKVEESFEVLPDSTWIYTVRSKRTVSALHALFRQLMGAGVESEITVYLPDDIPIALEIIVEEGGFEAELGGLWLTSADINYSKGGFELSFDEPTREPMDHLLIQGRMGGFAASRIGNASPRILGVRSSMGGAEVDLEGDWVRDCDIRLSISMGGMSVEVPDDLNIRGLVETERDWRQEDEEVSIPTLQFSVREKMGEIEVLYR